MRFLIFILLFSGCVNAQTITINGIGSRVRINNGESSITVNWSFDFPPISGDITFTDAHFQYSIPGYAKTNFTGRSSAGYVEFRTSETAISVKVGGDWIAASNQSDCEVLVDGVYNQSVRVATPNVIQTTAITLPPGLKNVRLVNGYAVNPKTGNITIPDAGVFIQGVITTGPIEIVRPVTPTDKWLFVGNSIETGLTATHPVITGVIGLFRDDGRKIQSDSWGARRLLTSSAALADQQAAWVSAQMDGTSTNKLFIFLGTNNYAGFGGQTKATFKNEYQLFLDSLHTLRPDIIIYCISPLNRTGYSTPNGVGATLDDYADAIQELLVTRTWAKFIFGKDLVSLANLSDGLHPNQTGHQQMHDNLLTAYNALQ